MLLNDLHHLFHRYLFWVIRDLQQIQWFQRLDLSVPFVFDRLHTLKPCQGLFDLIRSVPSQQLQSIAHLRNVQGNHILARRASFGGRRGVRRGRRTTTGRNDKQ